MRRIAATSTSNREPLEPPLATSLVNLVHDSATRPVEAPAGLKLPAPIAPTDRQLASESPTWRLATDTPAV